MKYSLLLFISFTAFGTDVNVGASTEEQRTNSENSNTQTRGINPEAPKSESILDGQLENTRIGQAIIKGDKDGYLNALRDFNTFKVRWPDIFSIKARDGKSIFDLLMYAKNNKEFFNTQLVQFVAMGIIYKVVDVDKIDTLISVAEKDNKDVVTDLHFSRNLAIAADKAFENTTIDELKNRITKLKSLRTKLFTYSGVSSVFGSYVLYPHLSLNLSVADIMQLVQNQSVGIGIAALGTGVVTATAGISLCAKAFNAGRKMSRIKQGTTNGGTTNGDRF